MKQLMIFVLLSCGLAMGQSIQDQRACYVQAHKVASKDPHIVVSNHFDGHTCWVRETKVDDSPKFNFTGVSIYNAFEPNTSEADFAVYFFYGNNKWEPKAICVVRYKTCADLGEFEKLTMQRYGF